MKVLAFDANSIVNRAFYGVRLLSTQDGTYTNAVYGFFNIIYKLIEEQKPDAVAFAFDLHAPTFRHKMYEPYKGTRKGMPEELRQQMPLVKELLRLLGYPILETEGYEADDILGSLARQGEKNGDTVLLCTGDRDSLQLITDRVSVILAKTAPQGAVYETMTPAAIREKYGVEPKELIEVKALMGDTSDNIPGVPGIGEKGALSLIQKYHTVEYIYAHLDELELTPSLRKKLTEGRKSAAISRELGTICCEVPVPCWSELTPAPRQEDALYAFLSRLELNRLITRLGLTAPAAMPQEPAAGQEPPTAAFTPLTDETDLSAWGKDTPLALSLAWNEDGTPAALCLLCGETLTGCADPAADLWQRIFSLPNPKIIADAKPCYKAALKSGSDLAALWMDTGLAGYLLNPNAGSYAVERQLAQHGLSLPAAKAPEALLPLARECLGLMLLSPILERELEANRQQKLLREMEQPLCEVLASMELTGFRIDRKGLAEFGVYLDGLTAALEQEIYTLAGGEFNINSPKQLGDVLFGKLELPAKKKTKSGYSTNAEVLEELIPYHPIVGKILEYRKYKKLSSTYVEGLKDTIGPDSRIRSVFRQTDTRTGRISSAEPNMQNIPIRTEPGSRMRDFFEAEEGSLLVDADYSQIELRVLAALANDTAMIAAFREGVDIHTRTAAQVFDLPEAFVTPQMRSRAKAVNFGIVYGIGAFSLSRDIGVSMQEANTYIKNYKETYSGIAAYLDRSIEDAREKGYAETLFGRRRPLPELKASNRVQRAFGERVAMNAPIQGTAADIIKIAMVRVYRRLKKEVPAARLILQVHDELIVETPQETAEAVRELVRQEMESAVQLAVPLLVDAKVGKTWGEAH